MDNTFTVNLPNNQHLQEISRTLDMDLVEKSPPHSSDLNNFMDNLSKECIPSDSNPIDSDNQIFVPSHLPSRILNQPISTTQDDITLLLQAVNKNIRRLNFAIPNISVESAHIDQECDLMQNGIHSMIEAIREAYKEELEFRKEMTRLEVERIEREKREAEERERKRIEDEKIEKERQEAMEREQARLAEEARKATEQARLEDFARNAPEFALKMREDQNDIKKIVSEHTTLFAKMFATLQSIEARLPPPSPQP
jgi:Asp-tRNA(Asn)/Glu-tRNA(Gln) amidotransferase A subunit family amidase